MDKKEPEIRVYAVGVDSRGRSVVWTLINGSKIAIPTDLNTFAMLAGFGVPIKDDG